ncbi:hypothetical protein Tco_1277242, partial [Tanacetum coccineum]
EFATTRVGFVCFGYVKRFLSQKGSGGGRCIREKKQDGSSAHSLGNGGALSGMGGSQISNTVDDVGKDSDGLNSSLTKVSPRNFAMNKEDNMHDENDRLTPSKSTTNLNKAISEQFANTAYGFFLGKCVAYPVVANYVRNTWDVGNVLVWVKLHGVPLTSFSDDSLSDIATKLGTSLILDSYTSDMCIQSWGRSS